MANPTRVLHGICSLVTISASLALTTGCSTGYRDLVKETFHPHSTLDWCIMPIAIPCLAFMLPFDPLLAMGEDADEQERREEERRERMPVSDAQMKEAAQENEREREIARAESNNETSNDPNPVHAGSSSHYSAGTSQRPEPRPLQIPHYANEGANGPEEQLAMTRILKRVEDDVRHRGYFTGFAHGVNFWTRRFTLRNGYATHSMTVNLPRTRGVVLYIASSLSFDPKDDGNDDVSDSCLFTSFSAMQGNIWLSGCSGPCCAANGYEVQRATSTLVTLDCNFKGLEWLNSGRRDGIVAVFALEIPE